MSQFYFSSFILNCVVVSTQPYIAAQLMVKYFSKGPYNDSNNLFIFPLYFAEQLFHLWLMSSSVLTFVWNIYICIQGNRNKLLLLLASGWKGKNKKQKINKVVVSAILFSFIRKTNAAANINVFSLIHHIKEIPTLPYLQLNHRKRTVVKSYLGEQAGFLSALLSAQFSQVKERGDTGVFLSNGMKKILLCLQQDLDFKVAQVESIISVCSSLRAVLPGGVMGCISVPRSPCCRPVCQVNMEAVPELSNTEMLA